MQFPYHFSRFNVMVPEGEEVAIYNAFAGTLAVLDKEELAFLKSLTENKVKQEELDADLTDLMNRCLLNNFIIKDGADEMAILEQRLNEAKESTSSLTVTILPTVSCNFACPYCFEGVDKHSVLMPESIQDTFIDWLESHSDGLTSMNVAWFGGEPTLGLAVMEKLTGRILEICSRKDIEYSASIVTNGSLLDVKMVQKLIELKVTHIQITLDGPKEVHDKARFFKSDGRGSYSLILDNVNRYQKESPMTTVFRVNVDAKNEDHCFRLIDDLAEDLDDVENISLYFAPINASTEMCKHISQFTLEALHYAELETRLTEYAVSKGLMKASLPSSDTSVCAAARKNGMVLSPNGDIHKCWETVTMNKYKIGNITDPTFDLHTSAKAWTDWSPFREQACHECSVLPICLGECPYRFRFKENYSGNSAKNICPSIKYNIENKLKLYLKNFN